MKPVEKVAFLCLGTMGGPMAGHLARRGLEITVFNRTRARAEAWCASHAGANVRSAETPHQAAVGAEIVFACSGDDADVEAITLGPDGAFDAMSPGSIFVDHTTASAGLARRLAGEAARRELGWLDAPVSGGQSGAEQGVLTCMVGGANEVYERVAPVLDHYARKHRLIGPAGHGQLAKMVNQICIAGVLQGLSEGLDFGQRVGLDVEAVIDVISAGAAGSWQMDNRAESMLEGRFDFGFAVDWMRKDLGIAIEEAARVGAVLSMAESVDARYAELQRRGAGRFDTSSLILALRDED